MVVEKLLSVRNVLHEITAQHKNNLTKQEKIFNKTILAITRSAVEIDSDENFDLALDMNLDNVFIRPEFENDDDVVVFSFQYQHVCSRLQFQQPSWQKSRRQK